MKITENKKGRCTGCCAAALSAGFDGTYDFLLVAPVFLHPAEKDAKNHLTNCYGGGYYIGKAGSTKKGSEHAEKIVRLILMSNISRRKFLKGAGVAALAVAAGGVLAGCSNVPDKPTPGVPDKTVHIYYMIGVQPVNGEPVDITVNGLATYVTYETIHANIPANVAADYDCAKKNYDIEKDGTVTVKLQKKASAKPTKTVEIRYYEGTNPVGGTELIYSLDVDEEATVVNLSKLGLEKTDYKLVDGVNSGIIQKANDGKLYVEVYVQEK